MPGQGQAAGSGHPVVSAQWHIDSALAQKQALFEEHMAGLSSSLGKTSKPKIKPSLPDPLNPCGEPRHIPTVVRVDSDHVICYGCGGIRFQVLHVKFVQRGYAAMRRAEIRYRHKKYSKGGGDDDFDMPIAEPPDYDSDDDEPPS